MNENETKTISLTFSYNDPDNNETTISKVVDLDENDETGILTLLNCFTRFLQLSGFEYIKELKIGIDNNYIKDIDK